MLYHTTFSLLSIDKVKNVLSALPSCVLCLVLCCFQRIRRNLDINNSGVFLNGVPVAVFNDQVLTLTAVTTLLIVILLQQQLITFFRKW